MERPITPEIRKLAASVDAERYCRPIWDEAAALRKEAQESRKIRADQACLA